MHGSPLGEDELNLTKKYLGFSPENKFFIPGEVKDIFTRRTEELSSIYKEWLDQFEEWKLKYPQLKKLRESIVEKIVPEDLEIQLANSLPEDKNATRALSGVIMQKIAELVPGLCGGSADLEPSTKTWIKQSTAISSQSFEGRNFHYGIREHAMGSINNGIGLYDGFIPFGATFLVFADYMRPAIRLAALMELQSIYIFTHDSIFVGEDGPTHQPIEQLASLRAIPNLLVMRPADGLETSLCWAMAIRNTSGPSCTVTYSSKSTGFGSG